MVDIASLGLAIDSSKTEEAVKRLDALAVSAAKAEAGSKSLGSMSQAMGQQLNALIQIQAQQTAALLKMVEQQEKANKAADLGQKAYGGLFGTMKSGTGTMAGASAGMMEMARASETAWKAAEKLDDQFDSVFKALGTGRATLQNVSDDFDKLQRSSGQTTESILSLNRAIDQTALTSEQKAGAFTRLNAIINDTTGQMEGYRKRLEQYVGSLDGQGAGEIGAKLVTALNNTRDSAQRTNDALNLLGIQGAEALKKLEETGRKVYSAEMKELDSLQTELTRRFQQSPMAKLAERESREAAEKVKRELGVIGSFIANDPILDALFNPMGITTASISAVNRLGQDLYKSTGLESLEKMFTFTDKMKVQLALVNEDVRDLYDSYDSGLPKIVAFFDAIYARAKGYIEVWKGTYKPTIRPGDNLGQYNTIQEAPAEVQDALKAPAKATEQLIQAGRQLVAQYDEQRAALTRFAAVQETANKLLKAGAINVDEWRLVLGRAGSEMTRLTGETHPFVVMLREANAQTAKEAAELVEQSRKVVSDLENSIRDLERKRDEILNNPKRSAPRVTAGVLSERFAGLILTEEQKRQAADDLLWIQQMEAKSQEQTAQYLSGLLSEGNMSPSQRLVAETKALRQAAEDSDLIADGFAALGASAEKDLLRMVTIIQQIRKEFGETAPQFIEAFKATGEVPNRLKDFVDAFDSSAISKARQEAEKFSATQRDQIEQQHKLFDAIASGEQGLADYNREQIATIEANKRGYTSFEAMQKVLGPLAGTIVEAAKRMGDLAIATNAARGAAEAFKRAELSGAVADLGAMSSIDRREGQAVLSGRKEIDALPTAMDPEERIRTIREINKRVSSEIDEIRNSIKQGVANWDWDNTWDKAFASFNRRFAAADSVTRERMQSLSAAARELNNRNMGAEAIKVLEGRMKDLSPAAKDVVDKLRSIKDLEIAGEMARAARDTNLEVRAMERLAEAAGKGEAAMRAANRASAIERERATGGRDISAAEIAKEIATITQATNEYRGAAVQAQTIASTYFAAMEGGATSSAELAMAQEELNIKLKIGQQIEGDSAQMVALRTQKIRESIAAMKDRVKAEGDTQLTGATLDLQREVDYQRQITAEMAKRGTALATIQIAHEQNEAALRFYKTTFDALAQSESQEDQKRAERIQQYVKMTREMKQQAVVQSEIKRTQQGADEITLLRTEISLIGKSREERETILALMKLELDFKEKSVGLDAKALKDLREQIDAQKAQVPERIRLGIKKSDLEQEAQLTQEIWKNAIAGIQSSFASFFESALSGGTSTWKALADSLKRVMFQTIAQITAAMVFRPIVGGALNMLGASPDFMRSMGMGSYASGGGSASSGGTDWLGTGGSLFSIANNGSQLAGTGSISSWLGLGGGAAATYSAVPAASAIAAPAALLAEGGGVAAGSGLLGASGAAGVAGTTAAGGIGIAAAIPYIGLAIAAIALITSFLGNKKPSNKGAEFSFNLDEDWTTQFEGTKHAEQMEFVRGFAQPIQRMVTGFEKLYSVERRADATIGTNFGIAEGSSFFYDRGPRDGGIENRQVFKFDPEDEASIQAALDQLMVAFLKDADWTGLGQRLGEQAGKDVATALENSTASTLSELMADINFASSFDQLAKLGSGALDGTTLAIRQLEEAGRQSASSITDAAQEFFTKAQDLKLGAEEMGDGLTRADFATKGYIMTLLGLETNLDGVQAAGIQANAFMEELTPLLTQFGFTLEEIANITESVTARMEQAARQAAASFETSMDEMYYRAIYGSDYQTPSDTLVYTNGGYKFPSMFGPGGGSFKPLVDAINLARGGDAAALLDVQKKLEANTNRTVNGTQVMTPQEAQNIYAQVSQWYEAAIRQQTANNQNQQRDPLFGQDQGSGGDNGGGGTDNSELINTLNEQRSTTQDLIRTLEGTANTFGRLAKSLDDYRKSLLLSGYTTLTPEQQLAEARTQYQDALTRSRSSDKDIAAEGMNDLREASGNLLDKSRSYWKSSVAYQEDFSMVQKDLLEITGKAKTIEQQALDQLVTANATLTDILEKLDTLSNTGSPGSPTSPGTGTPTTPSNPGAGYTSGSAVTGAPAGMTFLTSAFPYASQGILFGVGGMGRSLTQNTAAFMSSRFPKYAGEMTEYAAYQWMQGAHESGLKNTGGTPLSRNAYYSAATKAGYSGAFGSGAHQGYLDADLTGGAWMRFITELRRFTGQANLKPGWFWPDGAANLPAGMNQSILTFAKGGVMMSPTMLRMANGRFGMMAEAGPEAIMPLARGAGGRMGVEMVRGANDNVVQELKAMLRLNMAAFGELLELTRRSTQSSANIDRKTGRQSFDGRRRAA
jgi:hypothetical protein